MSRPRAQVLNLLAAATLSLLVLSSTLGVYGDHLGVPKSSSEESEERAEVEDGDDVEGVVSDGVTIVTAKTLHIDFKLCHASPLTAHAWRWCSRGPPLS
jgi:hypothetical protein